MIRIMSFLMIALLLTGAWANELPNYLQVAPKDRGEVQTNQQANMAAYVLYDGENISLKVSPETLQEQARTVDLQSRDLYAARFLNTEEVLPILDSYGEVLYLSPEKTEAILRMSDQDKIDELAGFLHEHGGVIACGALIKLASLEEVMLLAKTQRASVNEEATALISDILAAQAHPEIEKMVSLVEKDNVKKFVEELSSYKNRYHRSSYGAASAEHIFQAFSRIAQSNPRLSVRKVQHSNTPQPSIVATLKGTTKPNEKIIIGCHIDSINGFGSGAQYREAPGADDNASGTATVKEVMRVLSTYGHKFKRTIEFHGYAAEEIGLVGSGNIASEYSQKKEAVIGMIQIDMCLYSSQGDQSIWLVTNDTSSEHNQLAEHLVGLYTPVNAKKAMLWGGTSDHRSWHRRGYAAIFPFENPGAYNRKIHTIHDTIHNSGDFTFAANYARLAIAYLASLAELDE